MAQILVYFFKWYLGRHKDVAPGAEEVDASAASSPTSRQEPFGKDEDIK
jgi:hypothetical protein